MKVSVKLHSSLASDDELRVRCAWLYFVGEMNQGKVAERLGITRARVNKLIAEAREQSIVTATVNVNSEDALVLQMEQRLIERHALDFCIVTPPMGLRALNAPDKELLEVHRRIARRAVGIATANFLRGQLDCNAPLTIGVGWSRTLEQAALHLNGVRNPQARFVSVMGSLTRKSASNPFEVVHTLANRTGGEGHFLPVPFIADSVADLKVFMSQRVVRDTLQLARSADFIVTSLGELREDSLVILQGMLSTDELKSIQEVGAVGDMLGRFIDASGNPVDHNLNRRTAAIRMSEIKGVPLVLVVAGADKIVPLRAVLKLGIVKALIIDGDAATVLLTKDDR